MDSIIILLTVVLAVVASIGAIVVCNSNTSIMAKHKVVHTSQHNDDSDKTKSGSNGGPATKTKPESSDNNNGNDQNTDNDNNNNDNPSSNPTKEAKPTPPVVVIEEPQQSPKQQGLPPVAHITPVANDTPSPSPAEGPGLSPTSPTVEIDPPIDLGSSGGGSGGHSGKGGSSKDKINCDNLDLTAKEEKKCSEDLGLGEGKNINLVHSPEITKFSVIENNSMFAVKWSNSTGYHSPNIFIPKNGTSLNLNKSK